MGLVETDFRQLDKAVWHVSWIRTWNIYWGLHFLFQWIVHVKFLLVKLLMEGMIGGSVNLHLLVVNVDQIQLHMPSDMGLAAMMQSQDSSSGTVSLLCWSETRVLGWLARVIVMEVSKTMISSPGIISLEVWAEGKLWFQKQPQEEMCKGCCFNVCGSFDFKGWCQPTQLGVASDLLESTPFSLSQINSWVTSVQTN